MKQINFPKAAYPITIRALRSDNRQEVWMQVLDLPNDGPIMVAIPPLRKEFGVRVIIRVERSDGKPAEEA
jgi:hypothetical protein